MAGDILPACTVGVTGSPCKMAVQELMLSSDPDPLKDVLKKNQKYFIFARMCLQNEQENVNPTPLHASLSTCDCGQQLVQYGRKPQLQ